MNDIEEDPADAEWKAALAELKAQFAGVDRAYLKGWNDAIMLARRIPIQHATREGAAEAIEALKKPEPQ